MNSRARCSWYNSRLFDIICHVGLARPELRSMSLQEFLSFMTDDERTGQPGLAGAINHIKLTPRKLGTMYPDPELQRWHDCFTDLGIERS